MNQITVAEIGSGGLTPAFYYQLLHNSYQKSAAAKNKLGFRTAAGINLYNQVDDAEALDSAMTQRARIEALNVADRSGGALDMAWLTEAKMSMLPWRTSSGIYGGLRKPGAAVVSGSFGGLLPDYQCAVKAMQNAYMPNSERKKQYLRIHADIIRKNETLVRYLVRLASSTKVAELLEASATIEDRRTQMLWRQ